MAAVLAKIGPKTVQFLSSPAPRGREPRRTYGPNAGFAFEAQQFGRKGKMLACSRRLVTSRIARRALPSSRIQARSFTPSIIRLDDLPYHIVVGMPALSPTMETGVLAEWYIQEGSAFVAGEALAKIETDKASIDFEAQDDGYVAKILMEAGTGADIPVNLPIMVTVEEEEDIAAFADFVPAAAEEPAAPEAAAEPAAAPVAPPAPVAAAPPVAPPAPVAVPPPSMGQLAGVVAPVMSTGWGEYAKVNSPLLKTLSKQQTEYIEKYGTTGQPPL